MGVKKLLYNWHQVGSTTDRDGAGEDMCRYIVGEGGVKHIQENEPNNKFEQWNYIVDFEDGSAVRVFNPNLVEYFKKDKTC